MCRVGNLHKFFCLRSRELEAMVNGLMEPNKEQMQNIVRGLKRAKVYFNNRVDNCINRLEMYTKAKHGTPTRSTS